MQEQLPSSFAITFDRQGILSWRLSARQVLPLSPEETFIFFRNPLNLGKLFPESLEFTLLTPREELEVREGAEFDYTIRLFGMRLKWQSRVVDYLPPREFTDIQLSGPYRSWRHRHSFEAVPEGTLLREEVTYQIPLEGLLLEQRINRQLKDLFGFRAARLETWAADARQRVQQQAQHLDA